MVEQIAAATAHRLDRAAKAHHVERQTQGYAQKPWDALEPRQRAEYRHAMGKALAGAAVVRLNQRGTVRVLNGHEGMTFLVDRFSGGECVNGQDLRLTAHVRDYRYPGDHAPWQIWSLGEDEYEVIG